MNLILTDEAKTTFLDKLSNIGMDDNENVGILIRAHAGRVIDYGITCEASGLFSRTIDGVLFYFESGLPARSWRADHRGNKFVSSEI